MGISYNPKVVVDQLVASIDASNLKSYSGSGSNIKNLVDNDSTNTLYDQVLVKSSRSQNRTSNVVTDYSSGYFNNLNTSSKVSLSNISVDPSSGGFTVCMLVKPQKVDDDVWGYWFKQQSSDNTKLVEFGTKTNDYFEFKDDVDEVYYGEAVFTDVGQHTWTVPTGVTQITAVCVGGGGGGGGKHSTSSLGYGGGGGGLAYGSWSVTPGDVLYIQVGGGGAGGLSNSDQVSWTAQDGSSGDPSYIKINGHGATGNDIQLLAEGGSGGLNGSNYNGSRTPGGGSSGLRNSNGSYTGGIGGRGGGQQGGGGGGACGYGGNGGTGGDEGPASFSNTNASTAGAGGGGGGGGSSGGTSLSSSPTGNTNSGGGVGIYGAGSNGNAGTDDVSGGGFTTAYGLGGSGGTAGSAVYDYQANTTSPPSIALQDQKWLTGGGLYGGGGGGALDGATGSFSAPNNPWGYTNYSHAARPGGQGAVRIIWGKSRSYPSTNVAEGLFPLKRTGIQIKRGSWHFLTFGVTSDYRSFVSKDGAPKTKEDVSNWNNSEILTFSDIFGTGTSNFNCLWSNCMIYDKELTDAEIAQNYNAFTSKIYPPFQIVYQNIVLHLDYILEYSSSGGGNTWYDVSGEQNNATLTNLGVSLSNSGYFIYDWPGDGYITLSQEVALTGDFTLEVWVYKEQTMTSNGTYSNIAGPALNSSYSGAGGNAHNTQFHIDNGGAGKIGLVINATVVCNSTSTPVSLDTWHQLVWTRSGTTCKVYVDGVEHASGTNGDTAYVGNIGRYYITSGDSYAFIGRLSSVKLYDGKGLTSSEIMQNFNVLRGRYGI